MRTHVVLFRTAGEAWDFLALIEERSRYEIYSEIYTENGHVVLRYEELCNG